jgi:DNA processing protein
MSEIRKNTAICLTLKEYGKVGPKLFQQLLMTFGHPENLFDKEPEEIASMIGIDLERARPIIESQDSMAEAAELIGRLNDLEISVVGYFDDDYPEPLRRITDPPVAIYVKGDVNLLKKGGVALVGTTEADQEGIRVAVDLARQICGHDLPVVSGLAAGIDSAAHLGCLKNGGRTVAVLGCGHLNIYPEENIPLARLICESGAVVSEYEAHADAIPRRLVSRNRLISALADIILLVQIGENKRGELYAARAAINQGKPCFVYDPDDRYQLEALFDSSIVKLKELENIDELLQYIIR